MYAAFTLWPCFCTAASVLSFCCYCNYRVVSPPLNGVQPPRVSLVVLFFSMFYITVLPFDSCVAVFYPVGDMRCVFHIIAALLCIATDIQSCVTEDYTLLLGPLLRQIRE